MHSQLRILLDDDHVVVPSEVLPLNLLLFADSAVQCPRLWTLFWTPRAESDWRLSHHRQQFAQGDDESRQLISAVCGSIAGMVQVTLPPQLTTVVRKQPS